ncbi:hypothetical protein K0M31_011001 [Melipona bicolor]|uniref:Uncharacterized protein n=1 Tax=Melipona bicolor TaxID=60889 RepID=A0AA40FKG5_9HYME|nr:hypothetical protein K0M31_011001 [Melipona bicolor]
MYEPPLAGFSGSAKAPIEKQQQRGLSLEFDQSSFCGHSGSNKRPVSPPKTPAPKVSYLPAGDESALSPFESHFYRETTDPPATDRVIITPTWPSFRFVGHRSRLLFEGQQVEIVRN